jgi:hypothetical protein
MSALLKPSRLAFGLVTGHSRASHDPVLRAVGCEEAPIGITTLAGHDAALLKYLLSGSLWASPVHHRNPKSPVQLTVCAEWRRSLNAGGVSARVQSTYS